MLGVELIKKTFENKSPMNHELIKKLVNSRINNRFSNIFNFDWQYENAIKELTKLPKDRQEEVSAILEKELANFFNEVKQDVLNIFKEVGLGEKQAAVETEDSSEESEAIGKKEEGEAPEQASDEDDDEHKTPAEYVVERKAGEPIFNY